MRIVYIGVGFEKIRIVEILIYGVRSVLAHSQVAPRGIHDIPLSFTVAVCVDEDFVPSVSAGFLLRLAHIFQIFVCIADHAHRSYAFHSAQQRKGFGLSVANRSVIVENAFEIKRVVLGRVSTAQLCDGVIVVHNVDDPVVNRSDFLIIAHIVGQIRF